MGSIELRSDNTAGAAPEILAALAAANTGTDSAYGADAWTQRLRDRVRAVFEHPQAEVFPVLTGTAANAIATAALCPPWGAALCHRSAHLNTNECGAMSLYSGGAQIRGLEGAGYRLTPAALDEAFAATSWGDPHHSQPSVLSLTLPTDGGTLYSAAELTALTQKARERRLRVHLDGARLANALAASGSTPAELTWRAGVEVLSLGATKNGALCADAIVSFDPAVSEQLVYRLKRAGHVASKQRFLSAQLEAYLTDGLWLRLAGRANEAMARLAQGLGRLGVSLEHPPEVNMAFARLAPAVIERLQRADLRFYVLGLELIRLVTSFQTTAADVDEALARFTKSLGL
jgi:threonine aldolase